MKQMKIVFKKDTLRNPPGKATRKDIVRNIRVNLA